ncbi:hypothetical protein LTR84_006174 [Exophiala bonariae]|uniref:Ribosomal lysine N-methyltransferase 4 n=1 Tax=Exophiala bonariae TaxID=1690606 RepID=A0AAV9N1T9_9EURO|nr:hypothetical protein LTR84_006174 [Exophiala bonariae]
MGDTVGPSASLDFDQTTSRFLAWFTSADGTRISPKVELKDLRAQNAGRGAVAKNDIVEDEELFAIPRSLVLTTTTSSIVPSLLEPLEDMGAWPPLIVTIIYEYLRHEQSPWYPYFQVLPTTFDSLMFWNQQELEELQASAVVDKIGKRSAEESWKSSIIPLMLQHPDSFPLASATTEAEKTAKLIELAHMAGSLLMAYAFDIDRDENKNENDDEASEDHDWEEDDEAEPLKGMVPLADMLNADADRNNARLYQETGYLVMKATKPISQGEQIFNDYGPLPRSDLLRMYGYLTDNYAQYDVVEISYDLLLEVSGRKTSHDPAWIQKEEQLEELGLLDDGYAITRAEQGLSTTLPDAIPGELHMLLRALCTHDKNGGANLKKPKDSITVEEAALLQSILTKRITEYSTSYEADQALWASLNQTGFDDADIAAGKSLRRCSMALQVRMGEKEILHQLLSICQEHIKQKSEELRGPNSNGFSKRKHDGDTNTQPKKVARR